MSWADHQGAVGAAANAIGELQEAISVVTERLEVASSATAVATGGMDSNSEAGRNAFEFLASLDEKVQDLYRVTEQAVAELSRYGGGF